MDTKPKRIKDDTVFEKTGKQSKEWFDIINQEGGNAQSHKEIALNLERKYGLSPWWSQEVTVLYEKAVKGRITGATAPGWFEVGVNKTIAISAQAAWKYLVDYKGFTWLLGGEITSKEDSRDSWSLSDSNDSYQLTTFVPNSHIRLRWQKKGWDTYSILQIRVTTKGASKCTLTIHQEKLAGATEREEMRGYWKEKLEKLIEQMKQGS